MTAQQRHQKHQVAFLPWFLWATGASLAALAPGQPNGSGDVHDLKRQSDSLRKAPRCFRVPSPIGSLLLCCRLVLRCRNLGSRGVFEEYLRSSHSPFVKLGQLRCFQTYKVMAYGHSLPPISCHVTNAPITSSQLLTCDHVLQLSTGSCRKGHLTTDSRLSPDRRQRKMRDQSGPVQSPPES